MRVAVLPCMRIVTVSQVRGLRGARRMVRAFGNSRGWMPVEIRMAAVGTVRKQVNRGRWFVPGVAAIIGA